MKDFYWQFCSSKNSIIVSKFIKHTKKKVLIGTSFWLTGVIGVYVLRIVVVVSVIHHLFILQLVGIKITDIGFQQDGTVYHIAWATIDLLKKNFDDSVESCNGPVS